METTTWILIVLIATVAFLYDFWKKSYFNRKGIPCDRPLPFIGHYHQMILKGFVGVFKDMGEKPLEAQGLLLGNSPIVVINNADMMKDIMIRHFSHFYNRTKQIIDDYPLNKAITALKGSRWKQVRNIITPAFTANKMRPITALLNDSCDSLIKHMKISIASNPNIEVKKMYGDLTMDCIAKAGFGIEVDTQENPNSPFVENARPLVSFSFSNSIVIISTFFPKLAPVLNFLNIGVFPQKSKQFFSDVVKKAVKLREVQGGKRVDILQLMVNVHKNTDIANDIPELVGEEKSVHQKTELSEAEIVGQSLLLLSAGYETTNVALSFVSYLLATNPELQEKLYQEVQEMTPDRDSVTYATVGKMEYLDMFLSETLRLYPPATVTDRVCQESITINGYRFDKGDTFLMNIIGIHHNPEYWPDPEKFDPERFTKEAKEKRHPFAYLPFGTGPRNCIGMRFALMVLKITIVRMVQNFKFEPCKDTQIPVQYGRNSTAPAKGITLRVIARE